MKLCVKNPEPPPDLTVSVSPRKKLLRYGKLFLSSLSGDFHCVCCAVQAKPEIQAETEDIPERSVFPGDLVNDIKLFRIVQYPLKDIDKFYML